MYFAAKSTRIRPALLICFVRLALADYVPGHCHEISNKITFVMEINGGIQSFVGVRISVLGIPTWGTRIRLGIWVWGYSKHGHTQITVTVSIYQWKALGTRLWKRRTRGLVKKRLREWGSGWEIWPVLWCAHSGIRIIPALSRPNTHGVAGQFNMLMVSNASRTSQSGTRQR